MTYNPIQESFSNLESVKYTSNLVLISRAVFDIINAVENYKWNWNSAPEKLKSSIYVKVKKTLEGKREFELDEDFFSEFYDQNGQSLREELTN